jgi:N-acetyl-alpha-D-glucosaminyl L-malate synthase BshA
MSPPNSHPVRRIGIACYPLIGGSGILASSLGMELARRGHEIHLFSYARPVRLDLNAPRIHFHEVHVGRTDVFRHREYALPLAAKMAEVTRRENLELLHVHYAVPHAMAACLAAEMIGNGAPRIVTTLHGTDITLMDDDPGYRVTIEHALENSQAITAVSESLRRQSFEKLQIHRDIEVIPNFFVPSTPRKTRSEVRAELGLTDEFLVLHMSNLRPVKRIDLLLQVIAASRCRERIRLLVLAGGDFDAYAERADALGLRSQIIVKRDIAVVEDYLQAADAGLYTSELESFGLSILETLFHAKPVVAFRVGGIPEVVGDAGLLHDFGDIKAMAASLDALVASPEMAARLGTLGQQRAAEKFTAAKIVPMYESLYARVLG